MPRAKIKPRKCPHCPTRGSLIRGVCRNCYIAARSRIARGEVTDKKLVELGYWKPPGRRGGQGPSSLALDRVLATADA